MTTRKAITAATTMTEETGGRNSVTLWKLRAAARRRHDRDRGRIQPGGDVGNRPESVPEQRVQGLLSRGDRESREPWRTTSKLVSISDMGLNRETEPRRGDGFRRESRDEPAGAGCARDARFHE